MISICSPELGISPESNSGGEVYDREVIIQLAKKEVAINVLLPNKKPYPAVKNLTVDYAPIKSIFPPYFYNFLVFPYLFSCYRRKKFDILRIHNPYFVGLGAVLFKKFYPHVPLFASYFHLEETNLFQSFLDQILIKKFDCLVTISEFTKKEIIKKYKVSKQKIIVAYPGIDLKFKPKEKDKKLLKRYNLKEKKVLLFLGGLKKRKNPLFLLEILKSLKDERVILLIAGEGVLKQIMIAKCRELNLLNKVIFTGFVKEKLKVNYYNLADIVLLPSLKEGFGMIAAEAGACGKVVIASNNSALPEVIKQGKTGFLAETENVNDWLKKINLILNNQVLRQKMERAAIKYVREKFSWEKNAQIHLKVFNNLLRKRL